MSYYYFYSAGQHFSLPIEQLVALVINDIPRERKGNC